MARARPTARTPEAPTGVGHGRGSGNSDARVINTPNDNTAAQLKQAISETVATALAGTAPAEIAKSFVSAHADLIEKWTIERVTAMVRMEMRKRPDQRQMRLPGFEDLPSRIPVENGKTVRLLDANLSQLRASLAAARKRAKTSIEPRIKRIQELVKLIRPYARKQPGISVAEVFELRRERAKT